MGIDDIRKNSNEDLAVVKLDSESPQYIKLKLNHKHTLWQLITSLALIVFFICSLIIPISIYLFQTPDILLKSTVLLNDPNYVIDLSNLPYLGFHTLINIKVTNNNILFIPIHITFTGSFHTDSPKDRIIYGEALNQVLIPKTDLHTVVTADISFNLLEPRMYSIIKVFDACGLFGGGRTPLFVKIYSKTYAGYGFISIPIRKAIYNQLEVPCPVLEETFGQLVLSALHRIIPHEEQYNNTINNEIMGNDLKYIAL